MRAQAGPRDSDGLLVKAYAGTTTVALAFDIDKHARQGLLGFAVKRLDLDSDDPKRRSGRFLSAMLRFPQTPKPGDGEAIATDICPIQKFRWSDYTVLAGNRYRYEVHPVSGAWNTPELGEPIALDVKTHAISEKGGAIFNRAAAASQAFARKFADVIEELKAAAKKKTVAEYVMPPKALDWLSRGLAETIVGFLDSAGAGDGLDIAIYEFHLPLLVEAVKRAHHRGVEVRLLFHSKNDKTSRENLHCAVSTGLPENRMFPRKTNAIMHDKFVVLRRKEGGQFQPKAVLCGSTNWTHNGVYRQANVVHILTDMTACASYQAMFETLVETRDDVGRTRAWINQNNKIDLSVDFFAGFSPRTGGGDLDTFARLIREAKRDLLFATAFELPQAILDALLGSENDKTLRLGVQNSASAITGVHRDRTAQFAAAALLDQGLEGWLKETKAKQKGNILIHTKAVLVDFTSDSPTIISGSHNLSGAASKSNDENYLVIKGDTDLADIYGCELLRIYDHYRYRYATKTAKGTNRARPPMLTENDSWTDPYFTAGSQKQIDRLRFVGR